MNSSNQAKSSIAWEAIKKAYTNNKISVVKICEQFSITRHQLYKQAKQNNWLPRSNKSKSTCPKQGANNQLHQQPLDQPQKSQKTLGEALEFITMDLMQRIQNRSSNISADHDKDARTLSSLVRTYEKLETIESEGITTAQNKEVSDQTKSDQTADQRRADLAARLEKLINGL